ncbi:MAG: hypothetical protein OXE46_03220 [Chloroflexi bacterium]|nr:hypothetical protein [Chloroflexota bacterium]
MAQLERLWRALKLLGAARDLAVEKRQYRWDIKPPNTFYLKAEHADIHLRPHDEARILTTIELRGGFGWQIATDQDEAGVYIIARRKPIVGSIGRGRFSVLLPPGIHISLKLEHCRLRMDNLNGGIEFPPDVYESP